MKRAQSQIITVVLIILLVLGAIVIVGFMVDETVLGASSNIRNKMLCFKSDLRFTQTSCDKASGETIINIQRKGDELGNIFMKIIINDDAFPIEEAPNALESKEVFVSYNSAGKDEITLKIVPILGEEQDIICDFTDEITITCDS